MHSPLTTQPRVGAPSVAFSAPGRKSPVPEKEWLRRLSDGDGDAFEAIFHTYYNELCVYAERWLHSPDAAEEVVCDVFCRVWERRSVVEIRTTLAGYLYTAVRNRALRELRHERVVARERDLAISAETSPGMGQPFSSPDEEMEARRLSTAVEDTLRDLPPRAREAFLLQRAHALTYAEVGEAMGISASTVEKHMIRAIKLLRHRLASWC